MMVAGPAFGGNETPRPSPKRRTSIALSLAGLGAIFAGDMIDPYPRLIWNLSESAPRGLYWIRPGFTPGYQDYVAARLTPAMERLAAERHYLPAGIPLIKRVAAGPGDEICAAGNIVTLFGTIIARRESHDPAGRPMPHWKGCLRLGANQFLLVNEQRSLSFDGRYFGPTDPADLVGRAIPIWTY